MKTERDGKGGAANADAVRDTNAACPAYISENRGVRPCAECSVRFRIVQAVSQVSLESLQNIYRYYLFHKSDEARVLEDRVKLPAVSSQTLQQQS